jgi:hypothetical protein
MKNEYRETTVAGRDIDNTLFERLTTTIDTNSLLLLEIGTLTVRNQPADREPTAVLGRQVAGVLQAIPLTYPGNRPGIAAHPAIRFDLQLPPGQSIAAFLREQLARRGAKQLIEDWAARGVNLNCDAPSRNRAILFLDSNNKARNREYAAPDANTTQEEDLKGAGLAGFADDIQATLISAALVRKARDPGCAPSASESALLTKLRDGIIRTRYGALLINGAGRLRANYLRTGSNPGRWAFGAERLAN